MSYVRKNAFAYSMTTLASQLMHSIFSFYYVKIFLNVYRISEGWFNFAQVVFLIWNAVNDPLFGYIQDTSDWEIFRNRKKAILYGAPLFAISFLLPWFPWVSAGTSDWMVGIHLLVSLFAYDALFTFVLLAHCALFAELSTQEEDRHTLLRYTQFASILSPSGIFVCTFIYGSSKNNFQAFQAICLLVAVISCLLMVFTGRNITLHHVKHTANVSQDSKCTSVIIPPWTLLKQLISQKNLVLFVFMNFFQVFHGTFQSNFFLIFSDYLIGPDDLPSLALSFIAGSSYILPQMLVLSSSSLLTKYGSYRLILWSLYIKFFMAGIVYILGRQHIWLLAFMFIADRTMQSATSSLFNLSLSDLVDADMDTFKRKSPVSTMIFGTNALFTKPSQSLAPMMVVYILTRYGYQRKDASISKLNPVQYTILQDVMFNLMCLVPLFLALVQIIAWRFYTLRKTRSIKTYEEVDLVGI